MRRYIGHLVDTPELGGLRIRLGCTIDVNDDGYIQAITSPSDQPPDIPPGSPITTLPHHSFLLPTFTDLHIHPAQFLYSGTGLDLPLMEWLGKYAYQAEEKLDAWALGSEEDRSRVRKVFETLMQRLVEEGTGAILAFGTIAIATNLILAQVCQDMGLRAHVGKLSMDLSSRPTYCESSAATSIADLRSFIKRMKSLVASSPPAQRLVHPVVTPRFVPTSSDELLRQLGSLVKEPEMADVLIQSHMCESWDQEEWVKAVKGKEDHEVLHEHGLLTDRTIQAHVTGLTASNMELVHKTGTSIAHCPLSNVYFSDKQFPLREAIDRPLTVGLGSDIAGGYSPSIQVQMRHAVTTARNRESRRVEALRAQGQGSDGGEAKGLRVNWRESLFLATKGGAKALKQVGEFVVGAPFDAQQINLVDPANLAGIGPIDFLDDGDLRELSREVEWWEAAIEKWWCVGDVRNRSNVWVQGRQIR